MQHVKKMLLVPSETVARLQEKPLLATPSAKVREIDGEMGQVLRESAPDNEKIQRYEQLLQRCMHFMDEQRKPFKLTLPDETPSPEEKDPVTAIREQLASVIPKSLKTIALHLYDHLHHAKDIAWDASGTLSVSGTSYPGTNVIDIVGDCVRRRKQGNALSWEVFARALASSGVPLEFIKNTAYKRIIQTQRGEGITSFRHGAAKKALQHRTKKTQGSITKWRRWI